MQEDAAFDLAGYFKEGTVEEAGNEGEAKEGEVLRKEEEGEGKEERGDNDGKHCAESVG